LPWPRLSRRDLLDVTRHAFVGRSPTAAAIAARYRVVTRAEVN